MMRTTSLMFRTNQQITKWIPLNQVLGAIRDILADWDLAIQVLAPMIKTQLLNSSTECKLVKLLDLDWVMMVAPGHVIRDRNPSRNHLHVVMLWCLPTDMREVEWRVIFWLILPRKNQSSWWICDSVFKHVTETNRLLNSAIIPAHVENFRSSRTTREPGITWQTLHLLGYPICIITLTRVIVTSLARGWTNECHRYLNINR